MSGWRKCSQAVFEFDDFRAEFFQRIQRRRWIGGSDGLVAKLATQRDQIVELVARQRLDDLPHLVERSPSVVILLPVHGLCVSAFVDLLALLLHLFEAFTRRQPSDRLQVGDVEHSGQRSN